MSTEIKKTSSNFENLKLLTESCIVNSTLKSIGLRWKMQILCCFLYEEYQYGKLKQIFPTISDQILSKRLNELLKEDLIFKVEISGTQPKQYQYNITEKGKELMEIILVLQQWSKKWAVNGLIVDKLA